MKIGDEVVSKIVTFIGAEEPVGKIINIIKTKTTPFNIYFVDWGDTHATMHTDKTIEPVKKLFTSIW